VHRKGPIKVFTEETIVVGFGRRVRVWSLRCLGGTHWTLTHGRGTDTRDVQERYQRLAAGNMSIERFLRTRAQLESTKTKGHQATGSSGIQRGETP
jgi:hypothetical protein